MAAMMSMKPGSVHPQIEAHAALETLAWGLILPLGAIIFTLRRYPVSSVLKPRTNIFDLHYPLQILGMLMALSNFGLGISIGIKQKKLYNNSHTIIGTIVVGLTVLQPLWGVVHHLLYKRQFSSKNEMEEKSEVGSEDKEIENESSRHEFNATSSTFAKGDGKEREGKGKMMPEKWTLFGLFHRWIERVTITLAMINGGLGFMPAKEYKPVWSFAGQVAYSVLAPIVWITWMSLIVVGFVARRREGKKTGGETKVSV